jgi:hypothetical protein
MMERSRSRTANRLALVAILGILGTLLLVWTASEHVAETAGPSALASADDAVYFVAGGTLYAAGADGALRDDIPLASLGLDGVVSHLAVLGQDLLLVDGARGAVQRCNPARRACTVLARIPMPRHGGALALASAPEAGRIYIADTASHQLHAHGLDGKRLYRLDIDGGLKYPNEVIWLGNGRLLVVDTNHHRAIVVQDEGDGRSRVLQNMAAKNDLGGNVWPTAAARDGHGSTWVINSDGLLRNGELIVYDAAGHARRRVDLGQGADPILVSPLAGAVLLADYANYRLQRIGIDDYRVAAFGDAALRNVLQDLQERRDHWQRLRTLSIGLMLLFGLLAAVAGYLDWKARRALAPAAPPAGGGRHGEDETPQAVLTAATQLALRPDVHGVVWLGASRRLLRLLQAMCLLSLLLLGTLSAWMLEAFEGLPMKGVALMGAVALMVLGLNGWLILAMKRIRIGTDGKRLHVVDMFGRRGQGLPEAFVHTGRRLLLGRIAVPLPNQRVALFDKEAFAAVIEPMLERTRRSNEMAILWRNLRQGDLLTWATLAALVAAIGLRVWLDL